MNKKTILVSTLGADPRIISSLIFTFEKYRPEVIYYLVTDNDSVKNLVNQAEDKFAHCCKVIKIYLSNEENVKKIVDDLNSKINEDLKKFKNNGYEIVLDFTYGTKPISAGVFFWAVETMLIDELIYVTGPRGPKDNKIIAPMDVISIGIKSIYYDLYLKKANESLRRFRFGEVITYLNDFLSFEAINLLNYFEDFISGKFKPLDNQEKKYLGALGAVDFYSNKHTEIENYKRYKSEINIDKEIALACLRIKVFYLYDLIYIYDRRGQFSEVLALFVNFLDNFLSYILVNHFGVKAEGVYFLDHKSDYILRVDDAEKKPFSLSRKIELILNKKIEFFNGEINKDLLNQLITKRNNSIFGHGFEIFEEKDVEKILKLRKLMVKKFFGYNEDLYFWYPSKIDIKNFL
ncbi:MAG: hypothetical protein ACPLRN_04100 [Microgenomates group bacterium]